MEKSENKKKTSFKKELRKKYFETKRKITYLIFKKRIDFEDLVKTQIRNFLYSRGIFEHVQIHEIKVTNKKNHIRIYISAVKPGILIGRQGTTIDALELFLSENHFKKIIISINTFDVWKSFYPKKFTKTDVIQSVGRQHRDKSTSISV